MYLMITRPVDLPELPSTQFSCVETDLLTWKTTTVTVMIIF